MASWKVEVQADNTGTWASNGLRFPDEAQAKAYGADLFMRWTAVREWRAVECSEPLTAELQALGEKLVLVHIKGDNHV